MLSDLTTFQRKLVYGAGVLLLFVPIIWLGRPASAAPDERADGGGAGGVLAQKRAEFTLGESSLGNVDPSSATMNLVLFGLRGVATNVLWTDAMDAKEKKDWARLRSDVDSITRLQPHYEKVWDFQGWNLAYNVSAEWDNVEDRWYWVKEGTKFVMDGVDRNANSPDLRFKVGQIMGQKIGNADEKSFYRKYFTVDPDVAGYQGGTDPDFNRSPYPNEGDLPHHHLGSKRWYRYAIDADETEGNPRQTQMLDVLFDSQPAQAQRLYAESIEEEGEYGPAVAGWRQAREDWIEGLGRKPFPTRLAPDAAITLELESESDFARLADEFNARLAEGGYDARVTPEQIRFEVDRQRKALNYNFWRAKSTLEARPEVVQARAAIYRGKELFYRGESGDMTEAAAKLREGLAAWERALTDDTPESREMRESSLLREDLLVNLYYLRDALQYSTGEADLPGDAPLYDLWEAAGEGLRAGALEQFEYEIRNGVFTG